MAIETVNIPQYGVNGTTKREVKKQLGKDDFLLLLTKQLQNQDPMQPTDNMEFVSQMSQFSTLEQMTNMNKALEKFINQSDQSFKFQAMGVLGKNVTAQLTGGDPEPIVGKAESVMFVDGEAVFKVNENYVKMSEIVKIDS
jgi:flagellar basal-body rod modification protein FlgD